MKPTEQLGMVCALLLLAVPLQAMASGLMGLETLALSACGPYPAACTLQTDCASGHCSSCPLMNPTCTVTGQTCCSMQQGCCTGPNSDCCHNAGVSCNNFVCCNTLGNGCHTAYDCCPQTAPHGVECSTSVCQHCYLDGVVVNIDEDCCTHNSVPDYQGHMTWTLCCSGAGQSCATFPDGGDTCCPNMHLTCGPAGTCCKTDSATCYTPEDCCSGNCSNIPPDGGPGTCQGPC